MTTRSVFATAKKAFFHADHGWKTTHFWGPLSNCGIVGATLYSITEEGPEKINNTMTLALTAYSILSMRFAWMVRPRNYLLLGCHIVNLSAQSIQLMRKYRDNQAIKLKGGQPIGYQLNPSHFGVCLASVAGVVAAAPLIHRNLNKSFLPARILYLLNHPVGPFTVFFWAPLGKWFISFSNFSDFKKPVDRISVPQQLALLFTGLIWARWSFVITPVNYSLFSVNMVLMASGFYQLGRKYIYDPFGKRSGRSFVSSRGHEFRPI